ncbi:MAG: (5-formylfuran-3-yl)methyl phosphate synthase [Candidatus Baldrarchaeia archaeon]
MALLLVSPMDLEEAREAVEGGADIIDVKNPREGSLGANFPWIIRMIRENIPRHIPVSATVGDVPNLPGTVSLAALGAAVSGADIIKVGLFGVKNVDDAIFLMKSVVRAVKEYNSRILVVAAGYADAWRVNALDPMEVPIVAYKSGADIAMVDTAIKDGKRLFDFLTVEEVEKFVQMAHGYGLYVALAGSLRIEDVPLCVKLGADVIGVRSAACTNGDRLRGRISKERVRLLAKVIKGVETDSRRETPVSRIKEIFSSIVAGSYKDE